jgi:hypothetical protein
LPQYEQLLLRMLNPPSGTPALNRNPLVTSLSKRPILGRASMDRG